MAIQSAVTTSLRVIKETSYGVIPASPASVQEVERTGGNFSLAKDTYTSARIRSDRQTAFMRHGVRRAEGTISDELAIGSHTAFLESALGGTWMTVSPVSGSLTVTDSEVFSTGTAFQDFDSGDICDYTVGSEDPVRVRIVAKALDNASVQIEALDESEIVDQTGTETIELAVLGRKLKNGKTERSFTFEQFFPEITGAKKYKRATGVLISSMALDLPPTGLATVSYTFDGRDVKPFETPIANTVLEPILGSLLAAVNGGCWMGTSKIALLTALSMNIDNSLSGNPVVGSNYRPKVFMGRFRPTGSMTAYLEDLAFEEAFDEEKEINVDTLLDGDDGISFLRIAMPRVKLSSSALTADGEDGATVQCNYEALLDPQSGAMMIIQEYTGA